MVEVCQALRLEGFKVFLASDEGAGCILGVAVEVREGFLVHPPGGIVSGPLFLDDDSTFLVYLNGIAGNEMRVVVHHQKAGVNYSFTCDGNIVQHIGRVLHTC